MQIVSFCSLVHITARSDEQCGISELIQYLILQEIERVQDENAKLQERLRQVEAQVENLIDL